MDKLMYILPIVVIVGVAIFLISKFKGSKSGSQAVTESCEKINFCITSSATKNSTDNFLEVDGVVRNRSIFVGDSFRIVDKNYNILATRAVVEKIDKGIVNKIYIDEAPAGEFVTLILRTECTSVYKESYLERIS